MPRLHVFDDTRDYFCDLANGLVDWGLEDLPGEAYLTMMCPHTVAQVAEEAMRTGHAYVRPQVDFLEDFKEDDPPDNLDDLMAWHMAEPERFFRVDASMFVAFQAFTLLRHLTRPGESASQTLLRLFLLDSSPLHKHLQGVYPKAYTAYQSFGLDPMACLFARVALIHPINWTSYSLPLITEAIDQGVMRHLDEYTEYGGIESLFARDALEGIQVASEDKDLPFAVASLLLARYAWASRTDPPWSDMLCQIAGDGVEMAVFKAADVLSLTIGTWLALDYPDEYLFDPRSHLPSSPDTEQLIGRVIQAINDESVCLVILEADDKRILPFPYRDSVLDGAKEVAAIGGWRNKIPRRTYFVNGLESAHDPGTIRMSDVDQMLFGARNQGPEGKPTTKQCFPDPLLKFLPDPFSGLQTDQPSNEEEDL